MITNAYKPNYHSTCDFIEFLPIFKRLQNTSLKSATNVLVFAALTTNSSFLLNASVISIQPDIADHVSFFTLLQSILIPFTLHKSL